MKAIVGIDGKGIGIAFDEQLAFHLGAIEAKAHAEIAAAKSLPPASSSAIEAARLYERGAGQHHDELLRLYRAADAALSEPPQSPSMLDRLLGRSPSGPKDAAALERQHAALRIDLIEAERQALSSIGAVARAEKNYATAIAARQQQVDGMVRDAQAVLAEVARTRQVVAIYPHLVWSGPAFATWVGQKIERRRSKRDLRNLTNIWGIPLDFG